MPNIKAWISAARLRTLPLSISGIIVGSSLAYSTFLGDSIIFWLAIATTIGFQVLSNFANDYGDGIKGTDSHRDGEKRLVASGEISPKQMKQAIIYTAIFTLIIALILIYLAFGKNHFIYSVLFFLLGIASIIAAIKYTVGNKAYGYTGFGDFFVYVFFGLLSVLGTYFLFTMKLQWGLLLPATTIGLLSVAVLNLNNLRDIVNDKKHQKNTLVVKMGSDYAKYYHYTILIIAMICSWLYTFLHFHSPTQYLYSLAFIPIIINIRTVYLNKEPKLLDSELKKVALSTFLFAILFAIFH